LHWFADNCNEVIIAVSLVVGILIIIIVILVIIVIKQVTSIKRQYRFVVYLLHFF